MENWEKQFEQKFGTNWHGRNRGERTRLKIMDFISSELESARRKERERIEEHLSFVRSEVLDMPIKTGDKDYLLELLSEIPIHQNSNEQGGK